MQKIYDVVRKKWVPAFPEEIVRQKLLRKMIQELGYPHALIGVEKEVMSLPHLKGQDLNILKRRLDIICFSKDIHPYYSLYPLLIIECKSHPLTKQVMEQVIGYNHYVGAYFFCIANQDSMQTFWYSHQKQTYQSIDFLPPYEQLFNVVRQAQHENATK